MGHLVHTSKGDNSSEDLKDRREDSARGTGVACHRDDSGEVQVCYSILFY